MRTLEQLDRRIEAIKRALTRLGPLRPGSISRQYNICGTPGCRCKADPPQKHGPYHQLNYTWRSRSRTEFVRDQDLAAATTELANYQRLRALSDQWVELGIERAHVLRALRKPLSTGHNRRSPRPSSGNRRSLTDK
jgi:hypothetical protein